MPSCHSVPSQIDQCKLRHGIIYAFAAKQRRRGGGIVQVEIKDILEIVRILEFDLHGSGGGFDVDFVVLNS